MSVVICNAAHMQRNSPGGSTRPSRRAMFQRGWMKANRLQLNPATYKTEVLWCASTRRQQLIPTLCASAMSQCRRSVIAVRDLGVYIDADVTMRTHVTNTVRECFASLRQISSVRRALPQHALLTLVRAVALVITKL